MLLLDTHEMSVMPFLSNLHFPLDLRILFKINLMWENIHCWTWLQRNFNMTRKYHNNTRSIWGSALIRPAFIWFSWTLQETELFFFEITLVSGWSNAWKSLSEMLLLTCHNFGAFSRHSSVWGRFQRGYCYLYQRDSTFTSTPVLVIFFFFPCLFCSLILLFLLLWVYYSWFQEITKYNPVEFQRWKYEKKAEQVLTNIERHKP